MILFITRKFPPSVGGMERLSAEMTRAVGALAPSKVIAWRGPRALWPAFALYAFCRAVAILSSSPVRVVHLGDPVLAPLGVALHALFGAPWAVTAHGLDVMYPSRLYQAIITPCLWRADSVLCISRAARDACVERGVPAQRCHVVPVGIAGAPPVRDTVGERAALSDRLGQDLAGRRLLLSVGRLVPRKGVAWFVREVLPNLAARPDWLYLVVGEGPARGDITRAVGESGVGERVFLLGQIPRDMLESAYAAADVFVMPNLSTPGDMEGFGIVALEAAARGLAVLASRVDGIPDAVHDGENGLLLAPGDSQTWAAAINGLLEDPASRADLGRRARDYTLGRSLWTQLAPLYLEALGIGRVQGAARWNQAYMVARRGSARRRRRLEAFGIPKEGLLLDLGCGDGINTRLLEEMGHAQVISLDRSEELLRQGRPRLAVAADGCCIPFGDETFDLVLVDGVLHHIPADAPLAQIARILKPNGALYLVEPASSVVRWLLDALTLSPMGRLSPELRARRASLAEEWTEYTAWLHSDRRLPERLAQAGFVCERYRRTALNILAVCRRRSAGQAAG